jgi:hypothetical protein
MLLQPGSSADIVASASMVRSAACYSGDVIEATAPKTTKPAQWTGLTFAVFGRGGRI